LIEAHLMRCEGNSMDVSHGRATLEITRHDCVVVVEIEILDRRFGFDECVATATLSMEPSAARALAAQIVEVADQIEKENRQ